MNFPGLHKHISSRTSDGKRMAQAECVSMAARSKIGIRLEGDYETPIEFPEEGYETTVPVFEEGDGRYKLMGVPVLATSAAFGDVIEAERREGGSLRFLRVVERSCWRTHAYMVAPWKVTRGWGRELLDRLEELGGHWECVLGGLLFVCIPPDLELAPDEWAFAEASGLVFKVDLQD